MPILVGTVQEKLRLEVVGYVSAVASEEWFSLARGEPSSKVGEMFRSLEDRVLRLEPDTELRSELRRRMIADLDQIASHRALRIASSLTEVPVFLVIALLGYFWSSALLCVYEPKGKSLVFISAYFAFFGIVVYLMVALSNFFIGFGGVTPYAFELLLEIREAAE